jgi:hypothetical protein
VRARIEPRRVEGRAHRVGRGRDDAGALHRLPGGADRPGVEAELVARGGGEALAVGRCRAVDAHRRERPDLGDRLEVGAGHPAGADEAERVGVRAGHEVDADPGGGAHPDVLQVAVLQQRERPLEVL